MAVLSFVYLLATLLLALLAFEVNASIEWNNLMKSSTLLRSSSKGDLEASSKPWKSVNIISKQIHQQANTIREGLFRQVSTTSQLFRLSIFI